MTDHAEIRRVLEERRAALEQRTQRIQRDLRQPGDADSEERAVQRENDEVLARLDEAETAELGSIRAALARLDSGRYGYCERCRGTIEAERLRAQPTAVACRGCAEASEGIA